MVRIVASPCMASLTSLHLGGRALALATFGSAADLETLPEAADRIGGRVAMLGGGTNILAADGELPVVLVRCGLDEAPAVIGEDGLGLPGPARPGDPGAPSGVRPGQRLAAGPPAALAALCVDAPPLCPGGPASAGGPGAVERRPVHVLSPDSGDAGPGFLPPGGGLGRPRAASGCRGAPFAGGGKGEKGV